MVAKFPKYIFCPDDTDAFNHLAEKRSKVKLVTGYQIIASQINGSPHDGSILGWKSMMISIQGFIGSWMSLNRALSNERIHMKALLVGDQVFYHFSNNVWRHNQGDALKLP